MKRIIILLTLLISASLVLEGCGNAPRRSKKKKSEVPEWWKKLPNDKNYVFGKGTDSGIDISGTTDRGFTNAQTNISQKVETYLDNYRENFYQEFGVGGDQTIRSTYATVTTALVSQCLRMVYEYDSELMEYYDTNGKLVYEYYVVLKWPTAEVGAALYDKIQEQEELRTKYEKSEMMKRLEAAKKEKLKQDQHQKSGN